MAPRLELVAGDARAILVTLSTDDRDAFEDPGRFDAYLSLGGGMDPTWLDLLAQAIRTVTELNDPSDLIDARLELGGESAPEAELTVERVDPLWVDAVARVPDDALDRIAGHWLDRIEDEFGDISSEEKPWIRELVGQVVRFCRSADRAPDVVFVWALR